MKELDEIKARLEHARPGPWPLGEFANAAPADTARLTAAVEAVLVLHKATPDWDHSTADLCSECYDNHPCQTVAAVENALRP